MWLFFLSFDVLTSHFQQKIYMKHLTYQPNLFYFWHTLTTRFRDLDPLHHVNNAIYNSYFEEARIHFIATIPELKKGFGNG